MPLPVLLVLVVGGIGAIVVALHLLGLSKPRRFEDRADATRQWLREFPGDDVVEVTLNHRATVGFIQTRTGPGLVWSFGADTAARRLMDFRTIPLSDGIRVDFHDFTNPHVTIRLDPLEIPHWENLLRTV